MKDKIYPLCRKSIEDKEKYFFTRNKHYSKSIRITFTAGLADNASGGGEEIFIFILFTTTLVVFDGIRYSMDYLLFINYMLL